MYCVTFVGVYNDPVTCCKKMAGGMMTFTSEQLALKWYQACKEYLGAEEDLVSENKPIHRMSIILHNDKIRMTHISLSIEHMQETDNSLDESQETFWRVYAGWTSKDDVVGGLYAKLENAEAAYNEDCKKFPYCKLLCATCIHDEQTVDSMIKDITTEIFKMPIITTLKETHPTKPIFNE